MTLNELVTIAKDRITVVGINPIVSELEISASVFADLLTLNQDLKLTILYESDTENFNQSLCLDIKDKPANERISYEKLKTQRRRLSGSNPDTGLKEEIVEYIPPKLKESARERILIGQVNIRTPVNLIIVDNVIWCSVTTTTLPKIDDYTKITEDNKLYYNYEEYVDFLLNSKYLSKPNTELIWVYDKTNIPRCIAPRSAFYTTDFQRRSVWGFVFNRKGEMLLQQRSKYTKDNRLLWDKSTGGHVDLKDSSSSVTAKRELIEELFLPEAEYTKYLKEDLGDIIDFGEWNPRKRQERHFSSALDVLSPSDWVMFRATDTEGFPLTVTRVSPRLLTLDSGEIITKKTIFSSDVFFFIAPKDYLDTEEQMKNLVSLSEKQGAASDHKLVNLNELKAWIEEEESKDQEKDIFTDDLLHINVDYFDMLENFTEFLKYINRPQIQAET